MCATQLCDVYNRKYLVIYRRSMVAKFTNCALATAVVQQTVELLL